MSSLVTACRGRLRRWLDSSDGSAPWQERAALALIVAWAAAGVLLLGRTTAAQALVLWGGLALVVALLLRSGRLKVLGPVLFYDLVRSARRLRFVVIRTLYVLLMAGVLGWLFLVMLLPKGGAIRSSEMAVFANGFFYTFLAVQFFTAVLLTPAYTAGAIAEEKERKTIHFILATDLRDREIVLGKLASRMMNLGLLLLAGLPILSFLQFLGGVDPGLVLAGFAATALTLFSLAGLSMLNSVMMRRSRDAIVLTYLGFFTYHLLALLSRLVYLPTLGYSRFPQDEWAWFPFNLGDLSDWFNSGNVGYAVYRLMGRRGIILDDELPGVLRDFALFHGALGLLFVAQAVRKLRPEALREDVKASRPEEAAKGTAKKAVARVRNRPTVGAAPMLWKEVHAEGGMRLNAPARILVGVLVAASFIPTAVIFYFYFDGKIAWSSHGGDSVEYAMNTTQVRMVGTLVATLMLLAVVVRAANSVSGERENDTLDGLLTSRLDTREILFAKWAGAVLSVRWGFVWLTLIYGVGVACGAVKFYLVPLILLAWLIYAVALAGVGLWFSAMWKRTLRATVASLAAAVMLGGGHWLLTGVFCYMPLNALGVRGHQTDWPAYLQLGQTPPFVLGYLAMHGGEWDSPYEEVALLKMGAASLFGLGCWAAATFGLWRLVLARFRKATSRDEDFRPQYVPARPKRRAAAAARVVDTKDPV